MLRKLRAFSVAVALALSVPACGSSPPPMLVVRTSVGVQDRARVELREIDGTIAKLVVWNDGGDPIVFDRDAVMLVTPHGTRARVPGGRERTPTVMAGAARQIDVRFDWTGLASGDAVQLQLDRAISVRGVVVPMPPIELQVK